MRDPENVGRVCARLGVPLAVVLVATEAVRRGAKATCVQPMRVVLRYVPRDCEAMLLDTGFIPQLVDAPTGLLRARWTWVPDPWRPERCTVGGGFLCGRRAVGWIKHVPACRACWDAARG